MPLPVCTCQMIRQCPLHTAASDLYEALDAALEFIDGVFTISPPCAEKARAALAKARGEK